MQLKNCVRLVIADIWDYTENGYIIIPTNLSTNKTTGNAIMGRGLALQATKKFPKLKKIYGEALRTGKTVDGVFIIKKYKLIMLPVKFGYKDDASEMLISRSLAILTKILMTSTLANENIFLPVLGGGFGGLLYEIILPTIFKAMLLHDKYVLVIPPNSLYAKEEYRESFLPGIKGRKDKRVSMSGNFSDVNI